jgi:hypothetical protein
MKKIVVDGNALAAKLGKEIKLKINNQLQIYERIAAGCF